MQLAHERAVRSRKIEDLRWDLRVPCESCPFRKDVPKHEGVAKALLEYADQVKERRFAHTCHKTDPLSDYDSPKGALQHCAGAAVLLLRENLAGRAPLQLAMSEAIRTGKFDILSLRDDRHVFASLRAMGRSYLPFIKQALRREERRERHRKRGRCPECGAKAIPETGFCGLGNCEKMEATA
jgi:hypothetical protein